MNSITSVTYRRLKSFGNYENESVEATAIVEDGQDPRLVLEDLKAWVNSRLTEDEWRRDRLGRQQQLKEDLERATAKISDEFEALKVRRDKAVELLKKHGVDTTELEEIPF